MLKPKSPQTSFYGSYLYDRIVPQDHLLRKINQVVDFSFVNELVKDRYSPDTGRPAEASSARPDCFATNAWRVCVRRGSEKVVSRTFNARAVSWSAETAPIVSKRGHRRRK